MDYIKSYMNYNSRHRKMSILERIYLYLHKKVFFYRLSQQKHFNDKFIISIGNLTTGGTGKTPLTILLSEYFLKQNEKVLICLRGYKGSFKGDLLVAEKGKILTTSYISGDEPYLIAFKLIEKGYQDFKVAIGKKREELIHKYGEDCNIVILDDAFQNPSIEKDSDIVLIDINDDPDKIQLIPLGKYREPLSALERADLVVLTRINEHIENLKKWELILKEINVPYFTSKHIKDKIVPDLKEKEVVLVCGIGNPYSFIKAVQNENIKILKQYVYKDHHIFTNLEIQEWLKYKKPILTTEKDFMRLLYNPIYLQNKEFFYRFCINIEINQFDKFIKTIYKNI